MVQTGTISSLVITATTAESTLTRDAGNWNTDGFTAGNKITIYNSSSNTAKYTVKSITSATAMLVTELLTPETVNSAIVLSADTVLWNNEFITERITSGDSNSIQHFCYLNLRARDSSDEDSAFETNRVGLKVETFSMSTSRVVPAFPVPTSGIITGESKTIGLDLGMATKNINMSGIITEQRIIKKFHEDRVRTGEPTNPSVVMTAEEVAQLIHSFVDSSSLQSQQNLNKLTILIPSRVNHKYEYHTGLPEVNDDSTLTPVDNLPLIPVSWRTRNQDNTGTIYGVLSEHQFKEFNPIHSQKETYGLSGFIKSFSTQVTAGQPFIQFTLDFEVASIL